jgi:hypothetical protein
MESNSPDAGACVRRSRALPFTQAGLGRAIKAARAAGLRVTAIRPDGTIEVAESTAELAEADSEIVL